MSTAPSITRNGVSKTFVEQEFGKKSDNFGKKFFAPELTAEGITPRVVTKEDGTGEVQHGLDIVWTGVDDLLTLTNKVLRQIFADIYTDNLDDKGVFNEANWALDAADFSAGVAKLGDIEAELEELGLKQQEYVMDPDFVMEEDATVSPRAAELTKLMKEISSKIKPLRVQKAAIEAKYKERADKRKARKAAADALKKSQPASVVAEPVAA